MPSPRVERHPALERLVGDSAPMLRLKEQLVKLAPTEASVLILGESGSGKELVAQAIHALSPRRAAPLVAVNCGAISPNVIESELMGHARGSFTGADRARAGYFEAAAGGSLFLDEITETPPAVQVKLLRVLETRLLRRVGGVEEIAIDVRLIAASNRAPAEALRQGVLREDLLHRIAVLCVSLPPLRERTADIPLLAEHFLHALNREGGTAKRFAPGFLRLLSAYAWPGNVRELRNAIQRAHLLCDEEIALPPQELFRAQPTTLPQAIQVSVGTRLEDSQRALILETLRHCRDDKVRCAAALGISLKTLYNRLAQYGYAAPPPRFG